MNEDEKEYYNIMLDENLSFTKSDYRDAIECLMDKLDKDFQDKAMGNMSAYIGRLENQLTAEQLSQASNGAAAPLLNARDQYNRAEAWEEAAEKAWLSCRTCGNPSRRAEAKAALELARSLK